MSMTQRVEAALLDVWKHSVKREISANTRIASERQIKNAAERSGAFYPDMEKEDTNKWFVELAPDGAVSLGERGFYVTRRTW